MRDKSQTNLKMYKKIFRACGIDKMSENDIKNTD